MDDFDDEGALQEGDAERNGSFRDRFDIPVRAGESVTVVLDSEDFDPILEVTAPGAGMIANDDWEGSLERSRVDLVTSASGSLKIEVLSFGQRATGDYRIRVLRGESVASLDESDDDGATAGTGAASSALLRAGQQLSGDLGPGDMTLPNGAWVDSVILDVPAGRSAQLLVSARGDLHLEIMDPQGRFLTPGGDTYLAESGIYRVQISGEAAAERADYELELRTVDTEGDTSDGGAGETPGAVAFEREHHRLPAEPPSAQTITTGEEVEAVLGSDDSQLPSGESFDAYQFAGNEGEHVRIELSSSETDTYLMMVGPGGQLWENDDADGTLNSMIETSLPEMGTYYLIATTYRSGMEGSYRLKLLDAEALGQVDSDSGVAPGRERRGTLAEGDSELPSGEFFDTFDYEFEAGESLELRVESTEFDTYLMVRSPSGQQQENDDQNPPDTNAGLNLVTQEAGTYQVMVTSYRPGEAGAYRLAIATGSPAVAVPVPTPAPSTSPEVEGATPNPEPAASGDPVEAQTIEGELTPESTDIGGGKFGEVHTLRFPVGRAVSVQLQSEAFDTFLIVEGPGGFRVQNDDIESGNLNSGVEIPVALGGEYRITVTSFEPGDTGVYTLQVGPGEEIPGPAGAGAANGGGRVFGVFAGITDYPAGVGDLPECANDAIKLAQTLREAGLLAEDRQVVLTDERATLANVRAAMEQMAMQVGPNDTFVFFFSGHGNRRQGTEDPREIDGADETLVLYDGELLDDEMGTLFDGIEGRVSLLAIDSCFAGGFAKDVITQPRRMGMFSSEEDVLSGVASQFQAGGYLSHFLRAGLQGSADMDPQDRSLTAGELTHYVYQQFAVHGRDLRMSSGYQHLVVDRGAVRPDFVLWRY
jgi:hypothetical protein